MMSKASLFSKQRLVMFLLGMSILAADAMWRRGGVEAADVVSGPSLGRTIEPGNSAFIKRVQLSGSPSPRYGEAKSIAPDTGHFLRLPVVEGPHRALAPYINIPAVVVRPNAAALRPYFALRKGLTVRYTGNRFSLEQPDLIWVPIHENGHERLTWQSYAEGKGGLVGVFEGDVITLLDDLLYDLDVGALFIKVSKHGFPPGYMLLETLIGETEPATDELVVAKEAKRFYEHASLNYGDFRLYEQAVNVDLGQIERDTAILLSESTYASALSGGMSGGVHPLYATSTARALLLAALKPQVSEPTGQSAIAAVAYFFEKYIEADKVVLEGGQISWPYKFDWTMNWGIKLSPPWYSPFANSQVVQISALMYKITGDDKYRAMAQAAVKFIITPINRGGSEYIIDGFRLPAEYVYQTPPMPNVRVLDGELGVAIALYNSVILLGDSEMLRQSTAYFASLAMNLEGYLKEDGGLWFAAYTENMPEGYGWPMWALLQNAAIITKDRRFSEYARRLSPLIAARWCDQYGC